MFGQMMLPFLLQWEYTHSKLIFLSPFTWMLLHRVTAKLCQSAVIQRKLINWTIWSIIIRVIHHWLSPMFLECPPNHCASFVHSSSLNLKWWHNHLNRAAYKLPLHCNLRFQRFLSSRPRPWFSLDLCHCITLYCTHRKQNMLSKVSSFISLNSALHTIRAPSHAESKFFCPGFCVEYLFIYSPLYELARPYISSLF